MPFARWGFNHRFGLDDAVLIKNNHIVVAGGISGNPAGASPHRTW
jgi:nicotinate-nucleotide pyrophosphorylase (carboxylating)